MPKRTNSEIENEWRKLRALKLYIPRFNAYRTDRHALIDAQVEALSGGYTLADIKTRWPDSSESDGDASSAAEDAIDWRDGTWELASPWDSWANLAKVGKRDLENKASQKALQAPRDFERGQVSFCFNWHGARPYRLPDSLAPYFVGS
jgi:hypothetical protein